MKLNDTELIRLANDFIIESMKKVTPPSIPHSPTTPASDALHEYLYTDKMEIGRYQDILPVSLQRPLTEAEIRQLDLLQTCAYLQFLARRDRTTDCYTSSVLNGYLATIVKHYLALVAAEE